MKLTLGEITKAIGGTLEGDAAGVARGYSIDSRTLQPGDLFFAVKGPRFDGHAFVPQALASGAAAAVVEGPSESGHAGTVIRVKSTVTALQTLATFVRRTWGKPIIGVTGSAGKTTTKEMIAAVLSRRFSVLRSVGNLNNEFGMPLCLLRAEVSQDLGVLEMGMSAKGEIRNLAAIAEPNQGIVTNVNAVHLEFFKSVDEIAEAKAELVEGLHEPRVAYLNNDDERVRAMANRFCGRVVTYGFREGSDFSIVRLRDLGLDGAAFTVRHDGTETEFILPLLGQHNVTNAVGAIAVGMTNGVALDAIREAIAGMKPEKMRGVVRRFREGFTIIDDSYNSNPRALTEMIRFTGKLSGFERKVVVAGEMLELGSEGPALHRACGREAAQAGIDLVIGVRGLAREILAGASQAGMDPARLRFAADAAAAGERLKEEIQRGDVVLLKGSRGVKLELALDALRARFSSVEP